MPDRKRPPKPRREVPPPLDAEAFAAAVATMPLDQHDPGALAALLDRRPDDEFDGVAGDVLAHLFKIVRERLTDLLPDKRHEPRRTEVESRILMHLVARDGPISFRTHFLRSVIKEVGKYDQDLHREDGKPAKAEHGSTVEPWLDAGFLDPGEDAARRMALQALLARIDDDRHREAVVMHLNQFTFEEIGAAFDVDEATSRGWVRRHVPVPDPVERPGRALRQLRNARNQGETDQ